MKMLSAVLMLLMSVVAMASVDTKTFTYDGSRDAVQLDLRAEKTHTEYRYEQRHEICYRQDVFYRTVCHSTPQGRFCQTIPDYRTVSYPCTRTVQIPYEVHDYYTDAKVYLSVAALGEVANAGERITATLNGDSLSLSAQGSKNYIIVLKKQDVRSDMVGGVKMIDATYGVELVPAAPVVKSLAVSNISIKNDLLNFTLGPVEAREHLGFSLEVKKNPVVGSSTVLFDRELNASEILLRTEADKSVAQVNVDKLGVTIKGGRHTLTAKVFFKNAGKVLNASQFESLEASRTLIYKVR